MTQPPSRELESARATHPAGLLAVEVAPAGGRAMADLLTTVFAQASSETIGLAIIAPGDSPALARIVEALGGVGPLRHRTDEPPAAFVPPRAAPVPPPATPAGWAELTSRQRAVAVLAGEALTNRQIARRLRISPHTVNYHLRRIFEKLHIASRVELAAHLRGHRLAPR